MPIQPPSANTRVVATAVAVASPADAASPDSVPAPEYAIRLQRPKTAHTLGRRLLNTLSFGWYTKNRYNPRQWRAFRTALIARYKDLGPEKIDDALRTYDHTRRLSQSKASVLIDALDAQQSQGAVGLVGSGRRDLKPLAENARPLNASQSVRHRINRTRLEVARQLTQAEVGVRDRLQQLREHVESSSGGQPAMASAVPDHQSARSSLGQNHEGDASSHLDDDLGIDPADLARQKLIDHFNEAEKILRPGVALGFGAIELGQNSIKAMATGAGARFDFRAMAGRQMAVAEHLGEAADAVAAFQAAEGGKSTKDFFAIPLMLRDDSTFFREDHSVLVMLDFARRKVLYLDAKGLSPRNAEGKYGNTDGLQAALESLGKRAFGQSWNLAEGLLTLSNAKQQGANDCGAFTHDFARRLVIDGASLADIDRDFDASHRGLMRLRMLENILDQGLLNPPAQPDTAPISDDARGLPA